MSNISRSRWRRQSRLMPYALCLGMALASCAEWDDHYDADTTLTETQHATLWQNIEQNPRLQQFAALLRQTGYDQTLQADQTYTVWAPQDGTFSYDALAAESNDRLQREFVQNHIARNNYPASGRIDQEHVYMLNQKLMIFNGADSAYTMQGIGLSSINTASLNGTVHTLSQMIPFHQNIYESLNSEQFPIDSISDYFHGFDTRELNEEKSIKGPTVNGQITYLDSIFDERNELYSRYRAYINREDSNYTMLVPTNEAWQKARDYISPCYTYQPSFQFYDSALDSVVTISVADAQQLKDSIVNLMLLRDLFYNNNLYDNHRLEALQTGGQLQCDSLVSTTGTKVYADDARELFTGTTRADKSNGAIFVADSLRMRPWTSWVPEVVLQCEQRSMLAHTANVSRTSSTYVTSGTQNPEISGHLSSSGYLDVESSEGSSPVLDFYLPDVRSTTYAVYAVCVPANVTNASREAKPYYFSAQVFYAGRAGRMENTTLRVTRNTFSNDPTRIDTLYLGDITFPMAYSGTGSYYPYIRMQSRISNANRNNYDRNMRFDCIILRPKELDTFLTDHPDYKYDKDSE